MNTITETFQFKSLEELRDFLNRFKSTELSTILPESANWFVLDWIEERLSDGSLVKNARITTTE